MNDRLEIATRIFVSSAHHENGGTAFIEPAAAIDFADLLLAEDAKRSATQTASVNPLYTPATTTGELPALVVEVARDCKFNIHTPSRSHYFYGGKWYAYPDGLSNDSKDIAGCYAASDDANEHLDAAEATRPDRTN